MSPRKIFQERCNCLIETFTTLALLKEAGAMAFRDIYLKIETILDYCSSSLATSR